MNMEVNDKRFVNVVINQLFLGSINAVLTKSIKFQRTNLLFSVLEMIVKIHELDEKFAVSLLSTGNCVSSLLSILGSVSPLPKLLKTVLKCLSLGLPVISVDELNLVKTNRIIAPSRILQGCFTRMSQKWSNMT